MIINLVSVTDSSGEKELQLPKKIEVHCFERRPLRV
jgi:hypothetical protein